MIEKIIDVRKWEKYTAYLDVIMFLILIGCIYLLIANSFQAGFYHSQYADTNNVDDLNKASSAYWGIMGSIALSALVLFWIFYRYFKLRVERRIRL